MAKKKDKAFDFEASLSQLEELVSAMEDGELSLEESLQAFETGIKLTRECQAALQRAEQKVQILMDANGAPEDLDDDEEDEQA